MYFLSADNWFLFFHLLLFLTIEAKKTFKWWEGKEQNGWEMYLTNENLLKKYVELIDHHFGTIFPQNQFCRHFILFFGSCHNFSSNFILLWETNWIWIWIANHVILLFMVVIRISSLIQFVIIFPSFNYVKKFTNYPSLDFLVTSIMFLFIETKHI